MSSYISGFIQLGRVLLKSRNLRIVEVPSNTMTLFHRKSPLLARLALVFVAIDVMVVSSVVEYTWGIGDKAYALLKGSPPKKESEEEASESLATKTLQRVQDQPVWKKTLFSGIYVFAGTFLAVAILGSRARLVRTINYAKKDASRNMPPMFYLQAASHPKGYAFAFPARECALKSSTSPNSRAQMVVRVANQGGWSLDVGGATINGNKMDNETLDARRSSLQKSWKEAGGKVSSKGKSKY